MGINDVTVSESLKGMAHPIIVRVDGDNFIITDARLISYEVSDQLTMREIIESMSRQICDLQKENFFAKCTMEKQKEEAEEKKRREKPEGSVETPTGRMWTAKRIALRIGVSEQRIQELADSDLIPHHHVDNGPPLFKYEETLEWSRANLVIRHDGSTLPPRFLLVPKANPDPAKFQKVPESIRPMYEFLAAYNNEFYPTCVYFLCLGGDVVYVGQTVNLPSRLHTHSGVKEFDRVFYLPVPRSDLDLVETSFIKFLQPRLNTENFKTSTMCVQEVDVIRGHGFWPGEEKKQLSPEPKVSESGESIHE